MIPVITIREYDSLTGEYVRSYSSLEFGNILAGGESKIGVFDFVVTGVSNISDFKIMVHSSGGLEVSPSDAIVTDNIADNGNFGVEFSSTFEVKPSLTKFFTDVDLPVSVNMRAENITNYVYMNLSPGTFEKTDGNIIYRISFNYLPIASSSSSSSFSSSACSSSFSTCSSSSSSSTNMQTDLCATNFSNPAYDYLEDTYLYMGKDENDHYYWASSLGYYVYWDSSESKWTLATLFYNDEVTGVYSLVDGYSIITCNLNWC